MIQACGEAGYSLMFLAKVSGRFFGQVRFTGCSLVVKACEALVEASFSLRLQ